MPVVWGEDGWHSAGSTGNRLLAGRQGQCSAWGLAEVARTPHGMLVSLWLGSERCA
jgi:hypothetical protein